jgi:MoaA/NifB/PqqE/SkfB family radical SAM enzyme
MNLSYQLEADWVLLRTCNFRCTYCGIPPAELGGKLNLYATPRQWSDAFNATGQTWLLHITGGEPSVYPDFVELCEHLTRSHFLSINTNLSHPCLEEFADQIDPQRVHFINAALHYDERVMRDSLEAFIARAQRFQRRGFNLLVSSVMTPQVSSVFDELQDQFESRGLSIIPKAMRGWYEGRLYPNSYSVGQRRLFRQHLERAARRYTAVIERMGEAPSINMFGDQRFLKRIPDYQGKLCAAGQKFVQIEADGNVVRCNSGQSLGNILSGNVELFSGPRPCDTTYCPYFCEKYTNPPFVAARPPSIRAIPLIRRLIRN